MASSRPGAADFRCRQQLDCKLHYKCNAATPTEYPNQDTIQLSILLLALPLLRCLPSHEAEQNSLESTKLLSWLPTHCTYHTTIPLPPHHTTPLSNSPPFPLSPLPPLLDHMARLMSQYISISALETHYSNCC